MVNNGSKRRNPQETQEIRTAILRVLETERPATCRSVFYRLVSWGAIDKTEAEYKGTVIRLLSRMRLDGTLPWHWIADGTRRRHKPHTFGGLAAMLEYSQETYRRSLWDDQREYVEIWCEKDAIVGVLEQVTWDWDVPLLPCKGYPSLTYLHEAAGQIAAVGKPAHLYYFGDRDPSGVDIDKNVERRLRQFAPNADITFTRVAVLESQIEELALPTRPTKNTDSRSKTFEGESVEVDAIPPSKLREMARACIMRHIDTAAWNALKRTETLERETLASIQRDLPIWEGRP
jgi:hypothetical protein